MCCVADLAASVAVLRYMTTLDPKTLLMADPTAKWNRSVSTAEGDMEELLSGDLDSDDAVTVSDLGEISAKEAEEPGSGSWARVRSGHSEAFVAALEEATRAEGKVATRLKFSDHPDFPLQLWRRIHREPCESVASFRLRRRMSLAAHCIRSEGATASASRDMGEEAACYGAIADAACVAKAVRCLT